VSKTVIGTMSEIELSDDNEAVPMIGRRPVPRFCLEDAPTSKVGLSQRQLPQDEAPGAASLGTSPASGLDLGSFVRSLHCVLIMFLCYMLLSCDIGHRRAGGGHPFGVQEFRG
jgi:hypothetical protein